MEPSAGIEFDTKCLGGGQVIVPGGGKEDESITGGDTDQKCVWALEFLAVRLYEIKFYVLFLALFTGVLKAGKIHLALALGVTSFAPEASFAIAMLRSSRASTQLILSLTLSGQPLLFLIKSTKHTGGSTLRSSLHTRMLLMELAVITQLFRARLPVTSWIGITSVLRVCCSLLCRLCPTGACDTRSACSFM